MLVRSQQSTEFQMVWAPRQCMWQKPWISWDLGDGDSVPSSEIDFLFDLEQITKSFYISVPIL